MRKDGPTKGTTRGRGAVAGAVGARGVACRGIQLYLSGSGRVQLTLCAINTVTTEHPGTYYILVIDEFYLNACEYVHASF